MGTLLVDFGLLFGGQGHRRILVFVGSVSGTQALFLQRATAVT
ncbi:hypothetical protein QWZ10_19695 [Paracoccus cavernae]|uniref:Uncharacterized protein n=1 Tax=Paracoccus cavernae TaxID=1571207 RepID=A0ABT8DC23_9RHOB|nr:hypothetical protein [Paracoccus cavernae]